MKIDFVITELFVGGAERCLTELATAMTVAGDDVRVFSIGSLPGGEQSLLVDRLRASGIEVESGRADSVWQFPSAKRRLQEWMRSSPADVCQTFLFHANVIGTWAAVSADIPIRVGGLRVADANPIRCPIERSAIKRMTSVTCVSKAVESFAAKRLRCPADKSVVIPNGVDVSRFSVGDPFDWTTLGWPAESAVALFVGRLHPQKGIDLLQQQISAIAPARTHRRLLIVGDGPDRDAIDQWCEEIGSDRVQRLPWQPDVAPLMRACRVLILPSRYEGMPNVAMEAMAAGRPVVCSRAEGSAELLSHDWQNQTFDIGDGPAMANLANAFLTDAAISNQAGEINRARMRNDFSLPAMVDAYRSHYRLLRTRRLDV
ncbi:MAG: glycosyltransferase family 4 protein [Rubripirellula sp.]